MMWGWPIPKFQMITVLIGKIRIYVFLREQGREKKGVGEKGRGLKQDVSRQGVLSLSCRH